MGKMMKRPSKDEWLAEQVHAQLASICRQAYILARNRWIATRQISGVGYDPGPRWDGGQHRNKTYKSIWPKVAAFVTEHKLNPFFLARSLCEHVADSDRPPLPNMMYSPKSLAIYAEYKLQMERNIAASFRSNSALVRSRLAYYQSAYKYSEPNAVLYLLTNPRVQITHLYRYCLARAAGFNALVDELAPAAAMEILGLEKMYERVWGDFLPKDFVATAQQILMKREVKEEL